MPGRNVTGATGRRRNDVWMTHPPNGEAARPAVRRGSSPADGKSGTQARLFRVLLVVIALLLNFAWTGAYAQSSYPAHTITLIVPFAAGGPTDVVARALQGSMARALAQGIVIENVVGAGGTTAATRAMRAAPDGYTIILGHMGTHAAALATYPKLAYNPATDFAPIGLVVRMPVLVIARNGIPPRDLQEFIAYANQHGAELTMAHSGIGSVSFVTCALFNSILGLHPKLAAYQGSEPAMAALLADKADYMCDQAVSVVPQAAAHAIRVYAVASPTRLQSLPDVPTAEQAGLPQFDVRSWHGLFAPKDTPRPIIDQLNAALGTALADATVRKALLDLGSEIPDQAQRTPDALAALVKQEIAKWMSVLRPMEAKN